MNKQGWHKRPWPGSLCVLAGVAAALGVATPAAAQELGQNVPTQVSPLPHILPQTPPNLGAGLPSFATPGTEGALPAVDIHVNTVGIVGATAFPASRVDALTSGLAGQQVPLSQVEAARRALLTLYRDNGYVLTTVSLDIDAAGNVRFIVTEGRVVAVKLSQDIGPAGTMVLKFLNHLTMERPIREATLERWLLLAQQVPGVSVHAVLQAETGDPGALTLVAEVAKQNVSALVTADNRSYVGTGPEEALGVLDLNSVTSVGDQSEISLFHTSGNTDNFGQAAESFFIGDSGLRLKVFGGAGRAHPSGVLRELGYESNIAVFGGLLSYPVLLRRNQALTTTLRFDAVQASIYNSGVRNSSDSLRVARLAADYARQDLWLGDTRQAVNVLNLQESQGIPALGASPDGRPAGVAGRADEKVDFWKLNGSISRIQTLFSPYPAASVALRLEAGGQYSTDILPSEEQFYLGGSRFTRGYYSGQVVGDKALYATSELQFNTGYSFTAFSQDVDLGLQLYGFYDYGESWQNLKTDLNNRLASTGVGLRFGITRFLEFDGEIDERLTRRLTPASTGTSPLKQTGLFWGVLARY